MVKNMGVRVGVLALQGAFREHIKSLEKCGVSAVEIKFPGQLDDIDALIIPGGESTTIKRLLEKYKFRRKLDRFCKDGKPVFVTCAGLILIAKNIKGEGKGLNYIDVDVERNAYGRQIDSFEELLNINLDGSQNGRKFNSIFIRAPKIINIGDKVEILGRLGQEAVLIRENNIMASTFHPELADDLRIHRYFIKMIKNNKGEN
jgi:5'-phosphate synthase pdxT subunit